MLALTQLNTSPSNDNGLSYLFCLLYSRTRGGGRGRLAGVNGLLLASVKSLKAMDRAGASAARRRIGRS